MFRLHLDTRGEMPGEDPSSARFQEVFDDGKICKGGVAMEELFLKGFTDGFTKEAAKKAPKEEKKGGGSMAALKAKLFKGAEATEPAPADGAGSFKDYLREKYLGEEAEAAPATANLFDAWKSAEAAKKGKPPLPAKPGLPGLPKLRALMAAGKKKG
jgi:hypothetical protein